MITAGDIGAMAIGRIESALARIENALAVWEAVVELAARGWHCDA